MILKANANKVLMNSVMGLIIFFFCNSGLSSSVYSIQLMRIVSRNFY